ncbi:hypothetical protein MKW92_017100 [Papaver armeniacum]|nr:hypothetical protein MKW92_017100 [Papaver armeniacum]
MSVELIGGALVGAVVSELLKAVIQAKGKATSFKPYLEKLTITLESVIPKVEEIKRLDDEERMRIDDQKGPDLNRLVMLLIEGKILVEKCSAVQSWNYISKKKYSGKIQELDNDLIRFFQLDAQASMWLDVGKILSKVNDFDQQLKQLTTERDNGSSSNNGVVARDGGVNNLKAAIPTKPTMVMTSAVPQKVGSANADNKSDRQSEKAAPIKPRDHDLKAAVPTKAAIILTSADPQKVDSVKAIEKLVRYSESAALIKPYDNNLKAVPITRANRQKYVTSGSSINESVAASEVMSFRNVGSVAGYHKSNGGIARTSLSAGSDLKFLLNCDYKEIETPRSSSSTAYETPWTLSGPTHSSAILYGASQLVVLTRFRNYKWLDIRFNYDSVRMDHHRHMGLVESVRHENVVPLRAYCYHFVPVPVNEHSCSLDVEIVLVYDYCRKGSVHQMLHGEPNVPLDWDTRLRAAIGAARGIAFIHRQDNGTFFHGGIKSENIFLNAGNYGCISELGKCITGYREPYIKKYPNRTLDVYNYGIFLLELVTGNFPFDGFVEKFKKRIIIEEHLIRKIEHFIRRKQLKPKKSCFQLLDPELVKHYEELKEQLIEMLRIALICLDEIIACTPSVNAVVAALEVLSFRDDESAPMYGKSFGGVAKTSLSEGLDLSYLLNGHFEKIETPRSSRSTDYEPPWIVSQTTYSRATLCKAAQLVVLTRFRSYGPPKLCFSGSPDCSGWPKFRWTYEFVIIIITNFSKVKVLFDWDTRLRAAIGAARGIAFIHRQDNGTFFHGSIKSENIFLNAGNYGCISELGRCLAGYREPYVEGGYSLRDFDVHNYGVLLLELVTGIYPYYGIVKEFKTCIGSRGQLLNKVEYFIRLKKLNSEELCFQLLDPELVKRCGELKKQLVEMLWIAWDCVAYEAPSMDNVLKRVERIDPSYIQFKTVF